MENYAKKKSCQRIVAGLFPQYTPAGLTNLYDLKLAGLLTARVTEPILGKLAPRDVWLPDESMPTTSPSQLLFPEPAVITRSKLVSR